MTDEPHLSRGTVLWRLLLTTLLIGLILAVADLLVVSLSVCLLISAGVLFGVFLNGISGWLARRTPLSYHGAFAVVVIVIVGSSAAGVFYLGSQIAGQTTQLWSEVQTAGGRLLDRISQFPWSQPFLQNEGSIAQQLPAGKDLLTHVLSGVWWATWAFTAVLVIFFVGLYVAFDPDLYQTGLVKLLPREHRSRATDALHMLNSSLRDWIVGRLISMSIVGLVTAVGLWLLDVPLPGSLGVLAALLTFIPNIGPVLAAIPQALLALNVGTSTVVYVIVFNIALQTFESYLITPLIQRYEVSLPPALTIFTQLLMGSVVGIIGVIMAAPLTVAIMALVQMLYVQDRLGDEDPGDLAERV